MAGDVTVLRKVLASMSLLLATSGMAAAPAASTKDARLRIIPVDVEGGAATLYITPQGHSLLIDAGWPAGMGGARPAEGAPAPAPTPTSAERIVAQLKAAGVGKLDYLLLTHYHIDHIGGAIELMQLIPVGTFLDHGANREELPAGANDRQKSFSPATTYPKYLAAIGSKPHRTLRPGDTVKIDDLLVTAVDSDRAIPSKPLAGNGAAGVGCPPTNGPADLGGEENPRSLGIVATWGKARVLSLGDTTWDVENQLVCPRNLVGPIDLMFADNHGSSNATSPAFLASIRPTVLVIGNGPRKGADPDIYEKIRAVPAIQATWQLHTAVRSPDKNPPADQIANLDGAPDAINPLQIAVAKSGAVTITNPRNGFSRTYPHQAQ